MDGKSLCNCVMRTWIELGLSGFRSKYSEDEDLGQSVESAVRLSI